MCIRDSWYFFAIINSPEPDSEFHLIVNRSDQNKILTNALLTFLYRNGYPLVFGTFLSAQHLGYFRIEERLAFTVSLITMLVETVVMKQLIAATKNYTGRKLLKIITKFFVIAMVPTVLASASLAFAISIPQVQDCLLYTSPSPRDRTRSRMPSSA